MNKGRTSLIVVALMLHGTIVLGASVEELKQREKALESELRQVRQEIADREDEKRPGNQKRLDLNSLLKSLEKGVRGYGELGTTAQKQKFARDLRAKIRGSYDGAAVDMPLKVTNVRVPHVGRAWIYVDWPDAIPFLKTPPPRRMINAFARPFLDLNMTAAAAATIGPGNVIILRGTARHTAPEMPYHKLPRPNTKVLDIRITDGKHADTLGAFYLTDFSCIARKTGKVYRP